MKTKFCTKCGRELPVSEFNKCKKNPDGLDYWCRDCQKQYHIENAERIKKRQKEYYQEHKEEQAIYRLEHREDRINYMKRWHATNKEHEKEMGAKYRKEHKTQINEYNKEYYQKNKEKESNRKKEYSNTLIGWSRSIVHHCIEADKKANRIDKELPDNYIDVEWTMQQIQKGCAHKNKCGTTDWRKIGLNRIDNSLPHTKDNCEPCCWECNHDLARNIRSKKVYLYKDNTFIGEFESTREAARQIGANNSGVSSCCNGKQKTCKGYICSYEKLLEDIASQEL